MRRAALLACALALLGAGPAQAASPFAWRGVIEGMYGPPWDHGMRTRVLGGPPTARAAPRPWRWARLRGSPDGRGSSPATRGGCAGGACGSSSPAPTRARGVVRVRAGRRTLGRARLRSRRSGRRVAIVRLRRVPRRARVSFAGARPMTVLLRR
jgi:hypothetical protein